MVEVALRPKTVSGHVSEWQRSLDWTILGAGFVLVAVGLLLSLAAGPSAADRLNYADSFYFVKRHVVFAAGAVIVLMGLTVLDKIWVRRIATLMFFAALATMIYILLFGHEAKGAQRWIRIAGSTFQPSEIVKPALIVMTGWLLAQRRSDPEGPWALVTLVFFITTLGLLLLQPDVGQSALLSAAFIITFFVSGLPMRLAAIFAGGGVALAAGLFFTLSHVRQRIRSFIFPSEYDTYQVDKAKEAIANGGLFGVGPGEGKVKFSLPDAHTDFIYAVLGEEYGYIAALGLILIFAYIVWRGVKSAARLHDPYPRAAATGLFALFGMQAAINIAVNVNLIPPKGMTLPFISYGGSSMLGTAITLGLAIALIRKRV